MMLRLWCRFGGGGMVRFWPRFRFGRGRCMVVAVVMMWGWGRCMMMVVVIIIPIIRNEGIQHQITRGKEQGKRCRKCNCCCFNVHVWGLMFLKCRLFSVMCFSEDSAYGLGIFAAHASIHTCTLGGFGVEVRPVVYQPLHNLHVA